jgi:hypothetical protein
MQLHNPVLVKLHCVTWDAERHHPPCPCQTGRNSSNLWTATRCHTSTGMPAINFLRSSIFLQTFHFRSHRIKSCYLVDEKTFEIIRFPKIFGTSRLVVDGDDHFQRLNVTGWSFTGTYNTWSPAVHKQWFNCRRSGASSDNLTLYCDQSINQLPTDHDIIPSRNSVYAHAQDFATSNELLLAILKVSVPSQMNKQQTAGFHMFTYTQNL